MAAWKRRNCWCKALNQQNKTEAGTTCWVFKSIISWWVQIRRFWIIFDQCWACCDQVGCWRSFPREAVLAPYFIRTWRLYLLWGGCARSRLISEISDSSSLPGSIVYPRLHSRPCTISSSFQAPSFWCILQSYIESIVEVLAASKDWHAVGLQ